MKKLVIPNKIAKLDIDIEKTLDAIFESCTQDGIKELAPFKMDWLAELNSYLLEMEASKMLVHSKHKSYIKYKKILTWLYENPLEKRKTSYINDIRNAYIEEGITCPYCGVGSSTTLDHYYCKSSLPQFSILKENLIPCCGECNKTKGTLKPKKKWRRIINPFFDDYEAKINTPPIVIHFKSIGNCVLFNITPNPLLSKKDRMHINFHLKKLKIKKKHKEKILVTFRIESGILKTQNQLVEEGLLTRLGYEKFIRQRLELVTSIGYDWSNIIFYSLYQFEDNHWSFE